MSSARTIPEGWLLNSPVFAGPMLPLLNIADKHCLVLWAQRSSATEPEKNYILLTISAPDVPKIDVDLKLTGLTFTGHSDTKKTTYHIELEFYSEIDVENSKTHHTSRDVEFVLRKKDLKEEYWPRLLKDSKRMHFLKTNFDKVGFHAYGLMYFLS